MADDLQEIVDAAADLLGAPATLEDRDFHLVAYAAHGDMIDSVRRESILSKRSTQETREHFERYGIASAARPVRVPADPAHGLLGRLCLPVRWNAVTLGYLWLLDDGGRIGDALAAQAAPLCERAGILIARQERSRADLGLRLDDLLSAQPDVRAHAVDEIDQSGAVARDTPLAIAVLRAPAAPPRSALSRGTDAPLLNPWRLPRSVLTTGTDQDTVLAVPLRPSGDARGARPVVDRARAMIAERLPKGAGRVAVGLFGPCPGLAEVRQGWLRARVAARAALVGLAGLASGEDGGGPDGGGPDGGGPDAGVRDWDTLGAERLLWCAPDTRLAEAVVTPGAERLLGRPELARTARVFLDAAGSVKEAAVLLSVHRQTLYHRLRRIEELTGLHLDDGRDRLALHLALTLSPHLGP